MRQATSALLLGTVLTVTLLCAACTRRPMGEGLSVAPQSPPAASQATPLAPHSPAVSPQALPVAPHTNLAPHSSPSNRSCTGEAVDDLRRLEEEAPDQVLACAAAMAGENPAYRGALTHWLLLRGEGRRLVGLPGYQAFARTTQLSFDKPQRLVAPVGWQLEEVALSPDGRYVASTLAGGGVGWWALDGSVQERYAGAGKQLRWHPKASLFAYVNEGRELHLVRVGPTPDHQVVMAPGEGRLTYPTWAVQGGRLLPDQPDPELLLAILNPGASPQGVAYSPATGSWSQFAVNRTPQSWAQVTIPPWIAQPWHPQTGYPITLWTDRALLGHPSAGTPELFYRLPKKAEPIALRWSPAGLTYGVVERDERGLTAQILRSFQDDQGERFSVPLTATAFAIADDGATTVTVEGTQVQALNHLTGEAERWQMEGPVLDLQLTRQGLIIQLVDHLVLLRYR